MITTILKANGKKGFFVRARWFHFFKNEENQRIRQSSSLLLIFLRRDSEIRCKNKEYSETTQMHLHHIIPKYMLKSTSDEAYFCESNEGRDSLSSF